MAKVKLRTRGPRQADDTVRAVAAVQEGEPLAGEAAGVNVDRFLGQVLVVGVGVADLPAPLLI